MTNEELKRWRGIITRCERFAPITINSKPRFEALLAMDAEFRRLRQRVAELEGQGDSRHSHQVRRPG